MKTVNHKSRTRERVSAPKAPSNRRERRAEQRKEARAVAKAAVRARIAANPRLVKA